MNTGEIIRELRKHIPFTVFGAGTGILIMAFSRWMSSGIMLDIFYVLHPMHVVLSALVTASIYKFHECGDAGSGVIKKKCNFWILLLIGYVGSIGIATLSDSVIPFLAETILGLPNREIHLGFIEKWWLINPLAVAGVIFAYFKPYTKFPHAGHVLLSTWASLFHIMMALGGALSPVSYLGIFVFLFLAVWLPCCLSDIVFPLLFTGEGHSGH
ncbi:MAG: hypothetical protein R6U43_07105 [Candidatus Krumholzibacteriales bacterium]